MIIRCNRPTISTLNAQFYGLFTCTEHAQYTFNINISIHTLFIRTYKQTNLQYSIENQSDLYHLLKNFVTSEKRVNLEESNNFTFRYTCMYVCMYVCMYICILQWLKIHQGTGSISVGWVERFGRNQIINMYIFRVGW